MTKFKGTIQCEFAELHDAVLELFSTLPSGVAEGHIIWNEDTKTINVYRGEYWASFLNEDHIGTIILGNFHVADKNFDYDEATAFSLYSIETEGNSGTSSNYPPGYQDANGIMTVLPALSFIEQRVTFLDDVPVTFVRIYSKNNSTWSDWKRVVYSGDSVDLGTVTVADHGTADSAEVVNVCYGTVDPPTASTTPEGTIFLKYTD